MGRKTRLLLIGTNSCRETFSKAMPNCDVLYAEHALEGLWQSGHGEFEQAFVSLGIGRQALRAVNCLRKVSPAMRIVVGCGPADEPLARQALAEGADEYILEPIRREDLEQAFGLVPPMRELPLELADGPSLQEIIELSEVLKKLGEGVVATLERLAKLLRQAFDAEGAVLQVDDHTCVAGETDELVLEELIHDNNRPIGRVALARRVHGTYTSKTAARLAEYARLIAATVSQAQDRERWRELAWTDDLSGLHNRRYFEQMLDQLIDQAANNRLRLTVLLFDIDGFKHYNDRYGHDVGDKLIQEVALLLRRCSRQRDIVSRYGGDEFAVVFWDAEKQRVPGSEHPHEPIELATRFCKAIALHQFQCLGSDAPGAGDDQRRPWPASPGTDTHASN